MKHFTFKEAQNYIFGLVPSSTGQDYSMGYGLDRISFLLESLRLPQEQLKVIHVAGTSGKGSTATFMSKILENHGYKTGLTVSPHITSIRERIQINNSPISEELFASYFTEVYPYFEATKHNGYGSLSYFEALIALAYYTFHKEKIDYAVIETGLGGTLDATNVVYNPQKLAVISRIGYDHMNLLGNTLREIAENKAGIIQREQSVIYLDQPGDINDVILSRSKQTASNTYCYKNDFRVKGDLVDYNLHNSLTITLNKSSIPAFQLENLGLALATLSLLSQRDGIDIDQEKVQEVVSKFRFLGRFEEKKFLGKHFILDGAHNPQKMSAFIKSLKEKYPDRKFKIVFACKQNKDHEALLLQLIPITEKFYLTQFEIEQDMIHKTVSTRELATTLERINCQDYEIYNKPESAIRASVENVSEPVVVTGSFFLISNVYSLFT